MNRVMEILVKQDIAPVTTANVIHDKKFFRCRTDLLFPIKTQCIVINDDPIGRQGKTKSPNLGSVLLPPFHAVQHTDGKPSCLDELNHIAQQ